MCKAIKPQEQGMTYGTGLLHKNVFLRTTRDHSSDPRTWELAAPTIDISSSLCLLHSTNLWQSSEEEAMSWWGLWWGPPAPTFWDHWITRVTWKFWVYHQIFRVGETLTNYGLLLWFPWDDLTKKNHRQRPGHHSTRMGTSRKGLGVSRSTKKKKAKKL